jgi:DGQHR domain-containing protein
MAVFACDAKELFNIVEINQRVEGKDEGYQRATIPSRVKQLATYIDGGGKLPTGVVVTFDSARFEKDGSSIVIPNQPNAGWVIDGQHRLAGARESKQSIVIPVIAFVGLSLDEQVANFITINKEQKGVPSSLYYDLLRYLPTKKNTTDIAKELTAELGRTLSGDEGSPFYQRIVSTRKPERGKQISMTNFIRKVFPHIERKGSLSPYSFDERVQIFNNMYNALHEVFPAQYNSADSPFFKTLGFGAITGATPLLLKETLAHRQNLRTADFIWLFRQIEDFDFDQWTGRGTGSTWRFRNLCGSQEPDRGRGHRCETGSRCGIGHGCGSRTLAS